jgi:hypothetical protein
MIKRTKVEWALHLASLGFEILPILPGEKTPEKGVSWSTRATTDADTIEKWFDADPDMNYGVHPGKEYVVVDLDKKLESDGVAAYLEMQAEAGDEIEEDAYHHTFRVRTPSGGEHVYLRSREPKGAGVKRLPKGMDVRGFHLYGVGPGSRLSNGSGYVPINDIDEVGIKQCPDWLDAKLIRVGERSQFADDPSVILDSPENITRAKRHLDKIDPAYSDGTGDSWTYEVACHLKDIGVRPATSLKLMNDPGPNGGPSWVERGSGWEQDELLDKLQNAFYYGQNQPGILGGTAQEMFGDLDEGEAPAQDVSAIRQQVEIEGNMDTFAANMFSMQDFIKRDNRREMIVNGWIPAQGLIALLAKRGTGKTAIMLDLSMRMACDLDWHGHDIMEGWNCVYICAEDDEGAQEMATAWTQKHDKVPDDGRMLVYQTNLDLLNRGMVDEWTGYVKHNCLQDFDTPRVMVFIDTWQRGTSRGAQSSDEDVQEAIRNVDLMSKAFHGPTMAAFHPPKNGAMSIMGSSVVENSTAAILEASKEADGRRLQVTRMKGKGEGNYMKFNFEERPLMDGDGEIETDVFKNVKTSVVPEIIAGNFTEHPGIEANDNEPNAERDGIARDVLSKLDTLGGQPTLAAVVTELKESTSAVSGMTYRSHRWTEDRIKNALKEPYFFDSDKRLSLTKPGPRWIFTVDSAPVDKSA